MMRQRRQPQPDTTSTRSMTDHFAQSNNHEGGLVESVSDWSDTGPVMTDAIYAFCGRCMQDVGATQDADGTITFHDHECVPMSTADLDAAYERARGSSSALVLTREQRNILLRALREIRNGDPGHPSADIAAEALREIGDE